MHTRYYITASKNGSLLYASLPTGASAMADTLPMHPRLVWASESTPTHNVTINLAFVREANLKKTIQSVEVQFPENKEGNSYTTFRSKAREGNFPTCSLPYPVTKP